MNPLLLSSINTEELMIIPIIQKICDGVSEEFNENFTHDGILFCYISFYHKGAIMKRTPSEIINRFMDLFYDNQAHVLWSFRGGSEGKMRFITPSDFYNAFGDCSDSEIEAAIEFYQNKKRKK